MRKRDAIDKKVQYWFESFIGKGTFMMILMLVLVALFFTCMVVYAICGGNPIERIWASLLHTLDSGVLAGDSIENKENLILMTIMTLFGSCFISVLIGIINSSFEQKLYEMRLGTTKVMEKIMLLY